jgi:pimeloyl-ACP methyl ester carboxylesterase
MCSTAIDPQAAGPTAPRRRTAAGIPSPATAPAAPRTTRVEGARRRPAGLPGWLRLATAGLAIFVTGCLRLTPLGEIHARLPADRLLDLDGQRVHLERAGEHGSPLVLLHGFGESSHQWRLVLPELARHHRVLALDLNGFGYTERPRDLAAYQYPGQARLVLATLDRLGIRSAHFAGHSWGGGLALWLAGNAPERVRSLVLVANTLPIYDQLRQSRLARWRPLTRLGLALFLRPGYVERGLRTAYHDDQLVTPELVASYLDRLAIDGAVDAYRGLTGRPAGKSSPAPPAPELEAIRQPALVVWGREDRLIPVEDGERYSARIPNARFAVLADCGHVPMEERPQELLALMLPFLAAEDTAPAAETVPTQRGRAGADPRRPSASRRSLW